MNRMHHLSSTSQFVKYHSLPSVYLIQTSQQMWSMQSWIFMPDAVQMYLEKEGCFIPQIMPHCLPVCSVDRHVNAHTSRNFNAYLGNAQNGASVYPEAQALPDHDILPRHGVQLVARSCLRIKKSRSKNEEGRRHDLLNSATSARLFTSLQLASPPGPPNRLGPSGYVFSKYRAMSKESFTLLSPSASTGTCHSHSLVCCLAYLQDVMNWPRQ